MSIFLHTPERFLSQNVFGIDEVGRGCLAGPVVAACVAFDWTKNDALQLLDDGVVIRDSKRMSRVQRKKAARAIQETALFFGFGEVDAATIDEINILQATFEAMRRSVQSVCTQENKVNDFIKSSYFFIDGNREVPGVDWDQEVVVDGDAKIFSIAAASIIAKEYRDSLMETLHELYPQYGFAQHKGYGTKQHYAAIAEHGVLAQHRMSFLKGVV